MFVFASICDYLTCYSNVNWSDSVLTVSTQLSVPFCTAISNYNAALYAISRQLKTSHQHFSSLNSVWFVNVSSGTATSSVISFAFISSSRTAASGTVSSTVHKLYCSSELFKYSNACNTMFSYISIKYIYICRHLLRTEGRHFIAL